MKVLSIETFVEMKVVLFDNYEVENRTKNVLEVFLQSQPWK